MDSTAATVTNTATKVRPYMHPQSDRFDHFVLQSHYGGIAGWEDLTAESSLEQIMERRDEYKENAPEYPYRVMSVWTSGRRFRVRIYPTAFTNDGYNKTKYYDAPQ